jgi:hypothetical protein
MTDAFVTIHVRNTLLEKPSPGNGSGISNPKKRAAGPATSWWP